MDLHLFLSPIPHSITTIFFILILVQTSYSEDNEQYMDMECTRACGNLTDVPHPFWGNNQPQHCGLEIFKLHCEENQYPIIDIDMLKFRVLHINESTQTMTIAQMGIWDHLCTPEKLNVSLNQSLFNYPVTSQYLSLFYNCPTVDRIPVPSVDISCPINDEISNHTFYFVNSSLLDKHRQILSEKCEKNITVPVLETNLDLLLNEQLILREALDKGFDVEYGEIERQCRDCESSGRSCVYNNSNFLCRDNDARNDDEDERRRRKLGIGLGAGFGGGLLLSCIIFLIYRHRRKKLHAPSTLLSRAISSDPSSKMDLEYGDTIYGVHVFTYSELEEATNHFDSNKELGDGGFGTVYYGKLRDGRAVAVKRLYENNFKRVEQFMNEVEILTHLRHQNLVTLYGCTSRHSRELLLVYEYIPNGTLADNLHGERTKPGALPWPIRLKIAIETASALTYLHASDIIHRDVKTNNILLDNNFCVKVADFGLSRLFPLDVTHVSTAPQGTPGYVDPEYHQCYQLTDRSDVFSFGVVLIELISSMPAVDITRHRHEINLSTMAINKIQNRALHELVDPSLGFESDYKMRKMISDVAELAFQCLQYEKDMRPSMEQVLEALKGIQSEDYHRAKAEEIDIPSDDAVLLKSGQLTLSPDSVTANWISMSTMSSTSG